MVNVRFSNFDDFYKSVINAPQGIKNILYKAYPEYARQLFGTYQNIFNRQQSVPAEEVKTISTQAKPKVNTQATSKAVSTIGKIGKVGKLAGKALPLIGVGLELPEVFNKDNPIQSRVLSGAGIGTLLTGHPVVGLGLMGASALNKYATPMANTIANKAYDIWDNKYGTNADNYDPKFLKLTPTEQDIVEGKQMLSNMRTDLDNSLLGELNKSNQELQNETNLYNQAKANYLEALDLANQQPIQVNNIRVPQTQLFPNGLSTDIPQVQEGGLPSNIVQVSQYNNQQALTDQQTPYSKMLGEAVIQNQLGLQEAVNNYNPQPYNQQLNNEWLERYSQLAQQQEQARLAQQQAVLAQYDNLVNQYRQAMGMGMAQDVVNSLANIGSGRRGPIQYVDPRGNLNTINDSQYQYDLARQEANKSRQLNNFNNLLQLQQLRMKDPRLNTTPNTFMNDLLSASVMADRMGISPAEALALGQEDRAQAFRELMVNRGKTTDELNKLPITTQADMLKEQDKARYKLAEEEYKANQNMVKEMYQQGQLNKRQYAEMMNRLDIANIQNQNAINLVNLKNQLDLQNPLKAINALGTIVGAGSYYPTPEAYGQALQNATGFLNEILGTNYKAPQVNTGNGTITPEMMKTMIKNANRYGRQ